MSVSNPFRPLTSSFQRLIEIDNSPEFNFIVSFSNSDGFKSSNITLTTTLNVARVISRKVNDLYRIDPIISEYQINWKTSDYPIQFENIEEEAIKNIFQLMIDSLFHPITISNDQFFPYLILFDSFGNDQRDRGPDFTEFKSLINSIEEAKCLLSTSFRPESIDYLSDHFIELLKSDTRKDIRDDMMFDIVDAFLGKLDQENKEHCNEVFNLLKEANLNSVLMRFLVHLDMNSLSDEMTQYIVSHLDYEALHLNSPSMTQYLQKFFMHINDPKQVEFEFTGSMQTYTVQKSGTYVIKAVGASGSGGNMFGKSYTSVGGNGAEIVGQFAFKKDEVIDIIVGGHGKMKNATYNDGASGGGGGGTFIFKRIKDITDNRYQFSKNEIKYEALLVAAGGSGGEDSAYRNRDSTGYNGEASNFKSPNNFAAYSTSTSNPNESDSSEVLGIAQFIQFNAQGSKYEKCNGYAYGGYGCGGSQDDDFSGGGGWCEGTHTHQATSWSLDVNAVGKDGANFGDGRASIKYLK